MEITGLNTQIALQKLEYDNMRQYVSLLKSQLKTANTMIASQIAAMATAAAPAMEPVAPTKPPAAATAPTTATAMAPPTTPAAEPAAIPTKISEDFTGKTGSENIWKSVYIFAYAHELSVDVKYDGARRIIFAKYNEKLLWQGVNIAYYATTDNIQQLGEFTVRYVVHDKDGRLSEFQEVQCNLQCLYGVICNVYRGWKNKYANKN